MAKQSGGRVIGIAVFIGIGIADVVTLFVFRPKSLTLTALLCLLGATIAALLSLYVPLALNKRILRAFAVGAVVFGALAAVLAIPQTTGSASDTQTTPAASGEAPTAQTAKARHSTNADPSSDSDASSASSDLPVTLKILTGTPENSSSGYCDQVYVPGGTPETVEEPTGDGRTFTREEEQRWMSAVRAQDVRMTQVEIRVQGKSDAAVVLQQPIVEVDSVSRAKVETTFQYEDGCGSGFEPRYYRIDLDAKKPKVIPVDGADGEKVIPAVPFPLKVSSDDPETIHFQATASRYDVQWHVEIPWYSEGLEGTLVIAPSEGQSFTTHGDQRVVNKYYTWFDGTGWRRGL